MAMVLADAAVSERWITDAELDANPGLVKTMSVKPPRGSGRVRLVEIAGLDLQPCGGTHVRRTGEIGTVAVTQIEKKGKLNRRSGSRWGDDPPFRAAAAPLPETAPDDRRNNQADPATLARRRPSPVLGDQRRRRGAALLLSQRPGTAETEALIDEASEALAQLGFGFLAVERKADGALIGGAGLSRPGREVPGDDRARSAGSSGAATAAGLCDRSLPGPVRLRLDAARPRRRHRIHLGDQPAVAARHDKDRHDPPRRGGFDDITVPPGRALRPHVLYRATKPLGPHRASGAAASR